MNIVLLCQCPSGKNAVRTTRNGHHYPQARFKKWREDCTIQMKAQRNIPKTPIDYPVHLKVDYWAGDKRTRDVSGMLDALFHLLVYCKVIADDGLIRDVTWRWNGVNKQFPKVCLELRGAE